MEKNKELIVYICNHGFAYDAMDAVRKVGAKGGTIIHGRSGFSQDKQNFLGITIHPEKDLLLLVCLADQKETLMKTLAAKFGVHTQAKGLCFSLKVSDDIGFNFDSVSQ